MKTKSVFNFKTAIFLPHRWKKINVVSVIYVFLKTKVASNNFTSSRGEYEITYSSSVGGEYKMKVQSEIPKKASIGWFTHNVFKLNKFYCLIFPSPLRTSRQSTATGFVLYMIAWCTQYNSSQWLNDGYITCITSPLVVILLSSDSDPSHWRFK